MTWTDEELGTLLAETFRDHELDEDGEDARRIAHRCVIHPRRRRWPAVVAAAAAIVVAGGLATYGLPRGGSGVSHRPSPGGTVAGVPSSAPGVQSPQPHLAPARAEAERLLDWVDLPGARAVATSPSTALAHAGVMFGLNRDANTSGNVHETRFWVVPDTTVAQVSATLKARTAPVAGAITSTSRFSQAHPPLQVPSILWQLPDTVDYVLAQLDVGMFQDGPNVDVRADAAMALPPTRAAASYVTGRVSSVRLSYQAAGPTDTRRAGSVAVTDAGRIARLTELVNGLKVATLAGARSCPAALPGQRPAVATMVFTSRAHTWTFRETLWCGGGVDVTAGPQTTQLQDGGFATAVEHAVAGP